MKVLITGVTGFLGKNVLPILLKNNVEVVALVKDKQACSLLENIVQLVEYDISSGLDGVHEKCGSPDALLHLAWGGLPNYNSMQHIDIELQNHYRFIKELVEYGVKNVYVAGTCFEYGDRSGPLSEDIDTNPNNPYGFAKDTLRKQLQFFKVNFPFSLTWMRLFYLYGDDQPEYTLYSQLRAAVQRGDSIFNMSGGEQLRDYMPVGDVVQQIAILVLKQHECGIVNICSGKPVSIRKLVERWVHLNKWDIKLNFGYYPYPTQEPMAFWGDNGKLHSIINM